MSTVICNPDGCAYMSYHYDLARMFLIAEYYITIDTSDWDTEEVRASIFDYMIRCDQSISRYENMIDNERLIRDIEIAVKIFYSMSSAIIGTYLCSIL